MSRTSSVMLAGDTVDVTAPDAKAGKPPAH